MVGLRFTNGVNYQLEITLSFSSNRWSASFGGRVLASDQPITTKGAPLNLGDIDAAWVPYDPNMAGTIYGL